ncbi:MAG: SusC/RagA family TonB-linked outer membrane protein [Niabella sp.]|nr:SusC/RagA family TonB-linked outer membrane protein [Niabella sp.]
MPFKDSGHGLRQRSCWLIAVLFLLLPSLLHAQSKQIQGIVTDANNIPVPNASVINKTTGLGVASNTEGRFKINASENDGLEVSAISYETTTVTVGTQTSLTIKLNTVSASLEDVVVVGYGSKSKRDVGGAVLSVDQKVLKDRPVTNTLAALQGTAPGLVITRTNGQPGREGLSARIRGITSLGAGNSPLVIIDGIEGDINSLNPNDIQSISVLEDAASASIYGAKAGGGVILVTTKGGRANQRTQVDITSMYTWRTPYARPELISSRKQAELQNAARKYANQNPDFTDEQLSWLDDPKINDVWNTNTNSWDYYYNYNLEDILMRKQSPQRNINLTASGGGDKSTFLFSLGYMDQQGVFKFGPDSYNRFNARLNYNTKLSKIFSLDSRLSFARENIDAPPTGVTGEGLMYGVYSIRAARNPIFTPGTNESKYAYIGTISTAYPILKDGGYDREDKYNLSGVFSLSAKQLLRGLDLKAVYSPGMVLSNRTIFNRTVPRYTIDKDMNPVAGTPINQVNSLSKTRPFTISQNFYATADYDYKVDQHSFHLLGGYEFKSYKYDWIQAIQRALLLNDFPTLNYTTLATADVGNVGDNMQVNTWLSYFGRLSYNFANKYYFEGTLRQDGSSRLAPGHKFQTFYAGNAFWRVAQENWFKNALPWVNELKLAVSYGTAGGAQTADPNLNNYDFQSPLSRGYYPFNDSRTAYFFQGGLPSESKAWEVISTANFGFDLEVLRRRLTIHYDYFIKKNNNVFVGQQLPALLGVTPNQANLAAVQVKGWGVTVNWNDKFNNGSYFISANLSDDKNKVVRYDGSVSYNSGINAAIPGMSTNSIFGYKADGYFDTPDELKSVPVRTTSTGVGDIKLVDVNNDGFINQGINTAANHGDLVYLGNTNSRYVFGFNAGVNWKGFDFSVLFNGVGKRSLLLEPYATIAFYDGWRMPWAIHEDYWTPDNPNAKFPAIRMSDRVNDVVSSHWVQDASYIRLKNLQVGYTLAKRVHHIKAVGDIRVYFSGQDLWEKTGMWFNYFDPENTDRVTFGYPLWRSYAAGLNISF